MGYADDGEEHFYDPDLNADEPLVDKSGEAKGKKGKGALSADAMKRAKNANQFKHGDDVKLFVDVTDTAQFDVRFNKELLPRLQKGDPVEYIRRILAVRENRFWQVDAHVC